MVTNLAHINEKFVLNCETRYEHRNQRDLSLILSYINVDEIGHRKRDRRKILELRMSRRYGGEARSSYIFQIGFLGHRIFSR